jgi:hypothetical protein
VDPADDHADIERLHDIEPDYLVRSPISQVALTSFPLPSTHKRSSCCVVDSAGSINPTAHKHDFLSFSPSIVVLVSLLKAAALSAF